MKKTVSLLLILSLLASCVCTAFAAGWGEFPDVPSNAWYYWNVKKAVDVRAIEGYPDGTFKPEKTLKYAEFIAMMVQQQTTDEKICLTDTGHWGIPYYNKGLELGLYGQGDIPVRALNEPIPRRAMARIAAGFIEKYLDVPSNVPVKDYTDIDISDSDEYAISLCSHFGVLEGYSDGSFKPEKTLKRCEAAKVADVCFSLRKNKEYEDQRKRDAAATPAEVLAPDLVIHGTDVDGMIVADNISGLMEPSQRAVMDSVLKSLHIYKDCGRFYFTYSQPQIPREWKIVVHCTIWSGTGKELWGYGNNLAVGLDEERWDKVRKATTVKQQITGVGGSLDDKSVNVEINIYDNDFKDEWGGQIYQLWWSPEKEFLRITLSYAGNAYIEETALPEGYKQW